MSLISARQRAITSVLTITTSLIIGGLSLLALPAAAAAPINQTTANQTTANQTTNGDAPARARARARHPKHGHKHKHKAPLRERAMRIASAQIGDPYQYGAAGPNAFDCSGLTSYSFAHAGERIPRTSAAQKSATRAVSRKAARRGDLVFFYSGGRIYHVGMYAGHGFVLHAPYTGARVRKERIWTSAVSFGRVR